MKIKRFFAPDIRLAMKMVKEQLGVDAVIMSNRSVEGGVEIVAAKDFDEQIIHETISREKQEEPKVPVAPRKKIGLPKSHTNKNPAHIVSSQRKRQVDGSIPQIPPRKKPEQYIGYAEKVALNTAKQVSRAAQATSIKNYADEQLKTKAATMAKNQKPENEVKLQSSSEKLLLEIQKELKNLRSTVDSQWSEANWVRNINNSSTRLHLLERLADMGYSKKLSDTLANRLGTHSDPELAWQKAQEMIAKMFPVAEDNLLEYGGIAALVGPTGVGKTTTIAKLAAKFILKHGPQQIALITTDNFRIAAHEQLNTYGRILDVPVRVAVNGDELHRLINNFVDKRLILIDTAGMSQRDMRLVEQISILQQGETAIRTYLVMSAATQIQAMNEIIKAFQMCKPDAAILTKLDETALTGGAISSLIEHQLPLAYVADGQQVPENLHTAEAYQLLDRCSAEIQPVNDFQIPEHEGWVAEGYA